MLVTEMLQVLRSVVHEKIKRDNGSEVLLISQDFEASSYLSYDVVSGGDITPCIKIYKTLVVFRFW